MAKSLYVHIPFCDAICAYCDFARVLNNEKVVDEYLAILEYEISKKDIKHLETIYIGGGTPSALTSKQLIRLFEILKPYTNNLIEYTIEINPESLNAEKAKIMDDYNINRASLGMQVTQNNLLEIIDRKHTIEEVKTAINCLKDNNINNISVDLMYGIPNQTLRDLEESLNVILDFNITHISLYGLTIEANSKFGRLGYKPAISDLDASMYELAVEFLEKHNFMRYEISNFRKDGYESLHNKAYWHYDDFIGVGLHASGKENGVRYTNTRNLRKYLNKDFDKEEIHLSKDDEIFEFIMMNLRLSVGFKISDFDNRFDINFKNKYQTQIKELEDNEMIILNKDNIKATAKGLELLFDVLEKFMED